jgi:hypothetical protein
MIEDLKNRIGLTPDVILKFALAGIIEGSLFASFLWWSIPDGFIPFLQIVFLFFLFAFIFSKITLLWSGNSISNAREATLTGFCCGVLSGITFLLLVVVLNILPKYSSYPRLFFNEITIVILIIIIIAFQAWFSRFEFNEIRQNIANRGRDGKAESTKHHFSKTSLVVVTLFVLIILVPGFLQIFTSWGQDNSPSLVHYDAVLINRLDSDSIEITLLIDPRLPMDAGSKLFNISIDDHDVSNLDIIRYQGLSINLNPADGLMYKNGSHVILSGLEISNRTRNHHIVVTEFYNDSLVKIGDMNI